MPMSPLHNFIKLSLNRFSNKGFTYSIVCSLLWTSCIHGDYISLLLLGLDFNTNFFAIIDD